MWLAANDSEVEGVFRWIDGYILTWENWRPEEPFGAAVLTEDCVVRKPDGKWDDIECSEIHQFYCEEIKGMVNILFFALP